MDVEVFSFFSGLGFLDLGFENAGFNIVFVNEHDERFLRAYQYARRNNVHIPVYGYSHEDVRAYLADEFWQASFPNYNHREKKLIGFIGGPPCPDFSAAGKNEGEDGENGQLTSIYVELITKRLPDFFVLENVKGLYQTKKHKKFYERMKRKLYHAGYSLFDSIENALEYGAPQYRDRLILVGFKRSRFGRNLHFEIGQHRLYTLENINAANWPTVSPFVENGEIEQPEGIIEELTVEHWFRQNNVLNHPNGHDIFAVKSVQRFNTIPEGDSGGKSFKRLHRWRYSPTAAYGNNEVHLHPYLPRRLSVAEALAVQSLPADFELPVDLSLSAKFKMVGNGVPYLLALGIAKDLNDWLRAFFHRIGE
ncbi:MAG: DNA cytosine methyltransferase [Clostridiales bacterium]|jgi:DNA (cytosine-5)-methyltransferase 1|nr:DNA cytosine methyltransferase [Clostridiales bacterium]